MPFVRVSRLLPLTVLSLALLFAVLEPGPSRGMSLPVALWFWVFHIGIGLLLAIVATAGLSRSVTTLPPWPRLLAGGVVGSLLFAPIALGLEAMLPGMAQAEAPEGLLDQWELQGGPLALLAEWLQLAPSYLASWLLINVVPLASTPAVDGPAARFERRAEHAVEPSANEAPLHASNSPPQAAAVAVVPQTEPASVDADAASEAAFLRQLPPAIGTDVVSIRSDLHYLQVRTTLGRAIVLGSIATAEVALDAHGLRVHRSYWVALRHVRRVGRSGNGWYCVLSDGSRVPVSRRRAGTVRERLGVDFVIDPG